MRYRIFTSSINDRDDLKRNVPNLFIFNIQQGSFDIHATTEEITKVITWCLEHGIAFQPLGEHS